MEVVIGVFGVQISIFFWTFVISKILSRPIDRIAQITSGSKVAFEYVIGAVVITIVGVFVLLASLLNMRVAAVVGTPVVTAIFAGLRLLMYHLDRRFYVGVFGQGGWPILMAFKPNVIEGVELNLDRAMEIAAVIRELAAEARQPPRNPPAPRQAAPADELEPARSAAAGGAREPLIEAQSLSRVGRRDDAIETLRQVLHRFPGTAEAIQAQRSLERAGITG